MKTAYELWRKTADHTNFERIGPTHPTLDTAMAAAGHPDVGSWEWANSDQVNMVPTSEAKTRAGGTGQWLLVPVQVAENDADRVELATRLALEYGQIDGNYHKTWVIDQMLRVLTGDRYAEVITDYRDGEDGPDTYEWDEGIAP